MAFARSSRRGRSGRGPKGGADITGLLLSALAARPNLTTVALYWLVKHQIPPEKAAMYWRTHSVGRYVKPKPLEEQVRGGGQRLTFEYLRALLRRGHVARKRAGKFTVWQLTDSGANRLGAT